jgi:hypothetical protein
VEAALTVSHEALVDAVHSHPADVVTFSFPVPPVEGRLTDIGDTVYEHTGAGAPACVSVNVCPATVSVPDRCDPALTMAE